MAFGAPFGAYGVEMAEKTADREATEFAEYANDYEKMLEINYPELAEDPYAKYADDPMALHYAKGGFTDMADYTLEQNNPSPTVFEEEEPFSMIGSYGGPPTARGMAPGLDFQMAQRDLGVAQYDASMQGLRDWRVENLGIDSYPVTGMEHLQANQADRPFTLRDVTGGGGDYFVYPAGVGPIGETGVFEGGPPLLGEDNLPIEGSVNPDMASYFRGADGRLHVRREAPIRGAEGLFWWDAQPTAEESLATVPRGWDFAPGGFTPDSPYADLLTVFANGNYGFRPGGSDAWQMVDQATPSLSDNFVDVTGLAPGNYSRPSGMGVLAPWELYNSEVPTPAPPAGPAAPAQPVTDWVTRNYNDGSAAYYDRVSRVFVGYDPVKDVNTEVYPDDPRWAGFMRNAFPDMVAEPGPGTVSNPEEATVAEIRVDEDGVWLLTASGWQQADEGSEWYRLFGGNDPGKYSWDGSKWIFE